MKTTVINCGRCGATHKHLVFEEFLCPIECDGKEYNYFAMCPVTDQPIIMWVGVDMGKDDDEDKN